MRALSVPELPAWNEERFLSELARPIAVFVVAGYRGVIAGYSLAWCVEDEMDIHRVAVDLSRRRTGTGLAMIRSLLELAPTARRIFLEVAAGNGPARALYRAAGFSETGRRPRYYGDDDAILLELIRGY